MKLDSCDIERENTVIHVQKLKDSTESTGLIEVEISGRVIYLIALGAGRFIPWYPAKIK